MTTAISAVLDTPAVTAPAAAGKAPEGGPGFEAALSKLLGGASGSQAPSSTTTSTATTIQTLSDPIQTDPDGADVQLPAQAIAAFLAVFLAMAGQMLGGQQAQAPAPGDGQIQAANLVDGKVSSADQLTSMLDALKQLEGKAQGGDDSLESLFASLVDDSTDATADVPSIRLPQATTANDQLLELVKALVGQDGGQATSLTDGSLGKALDAGVQRLEGFAAKAADLGDALEQVAAAAAGMARELAAANGSVAANAVQPGDADDAGLVQAIGAAKALAQVAELGQGLNLDGLKGKSEITIQLQPGSLGKIHVQLERTSDGVTAKIEATTAAGQRAVEASIGQIEDALAAAGVEVGKVEVGGPLNAAPETSVEGAQAPEATTDARPVQATRTTGAQSAGKAKQSDDDANTTDTQTTDTHTTDATTTSVSQPTATSTTTQPFRVEAPAATTNTASTDAIRLAKDIADQVGLLAGQGKSEFQLQLRPEALGRLHMKLTVDDGGVTVRMQADSVQAKGMIESNLGQLKQSFQDQGLRVDRFVVELAQGQFSQDGQHPRRSRGWVDDVRAKQNRGDGEFAEQLAAAGARPVDYLA